MTSQTVTHTRKRRNCVSGIVLCVWYMTGGSSLTGENIAG